jgi:hypothetical protein
MKSVVAFQFINNGNEVKKEKLAHKLDALLIEELLENLNTMAMSILHCFIIKTFVIC